MLRGMHRNTLLSILADLEQRITFCEAELAYRRARLDRVGQATREAIDAIAGNSASGARAQAWADPAAARVA
jgi:hypothetical protein